jgi:hypothetical protein
MSKVEQLEISISMFPTEDPLSGVRKLFPDSTDEELQRIKDFIENYASAMWRIYCLIHSSYRTEFKTFRKDTKSVWSASCAQALFAASETHLVSFFPTPVE